MGSSIQIDSIRMGSSIIHFKGSHMLGIFYAFLSSADFFQNNLFQKILSGIPSVSNSMDPDEADVLFGLILVCKGYQMMILVGKS